MVDPYQQKRQRNRRFTQSSKFRSRSSFRRSFVISCCTSAHAAFLILWRGMKTRRHGFICGLSKRKLSQTNLLARLRTTAFRQNFLPHITPAFKLPSVESAAAATNKAPAAEQPDSLTASKSDFRVNLSLFSRRCLRAGTLSPKHSIVICYAESFARPFMRRRFKTRRPPLVAIRAMKPRRRFLLRLDG